MVKSSFNVGIKNNFNLEQNAVQLPAKSYMIWNNEKKSQTDFLSNHYSDRTFKQEFCSKKTEQLRSIWNLKPPELCTCWGYNDCDGVWGWYNINMTRWGSWWSDISWYETRIRHQHCESLICNIGTPQTLIRQDVYTKYDIVRIDWWEERR